MRCPPILTFAPRLFAICGAAAAMIAGLSLPAFANHVDTGNVSASCTSYTITVTASELETGHLYTISWTINGLGAPINDQVTFTASGPSYNSGPITRNIGPLTGSGFCPSGTVTLVGDNTVNMVFTPACFDCPGTPPPPGNCVIQGSINSNFNGTAIVGVSSGPAFIWFNSNFSVKGGISAGSSVTLTNSRVFINGAPYAVPDARITFGNVACATTTFDAGSNTWVTTVPVGGSDEIFLSGVAVPVTNLPGGAQVSWEGTFGTDQAGVCLSWKWGAAAYTQFGDYNAAQIKPTHQGACGINNGNHAGTPQNQAIQNSVTGGARGGGGSNFTGSWSGTGSLCPICK